MFVLNFEEYSVSARSPQAVWLFRSTRTASRTPMSGKHSLSLFILYIAKKNNKKKKQAHAHLMSEENPNTWDVSLVCNISLRTSLEVLISKPMQLRNDPNYNY